MKTLIVALITIIPFIGLSQYGKEYWTRYSNGDSLIICTRLPELPYSFFYPPDTLSAYLLVTTRHMGIAYQKRGFVVKQFGREPYYLDCDKREIKSPFNVWNYRIINKPK